MKNAIAILLILFSSFAYSRDTTNLPKVDTAQLFFQEVGNEIKLKDFQGWLYKNLVADKYDEFMQLYNAYLQQKYAAWLDEKRKKK